jgi:class 3 adenylate cyclase/pimeloyl-ACP methyl ester carboxylesterase
MNPDIRYVRTADDVSIAYWTYGEGPVLVVTPLVPYSHIEMEWQNPHFQAWYRELGEFVTVVRYDGRGTGLSQREVDDVSLEAGVRDLEAVVASQPQGPVALMGVFHSGPATMVYAARHPEQVSHLIPWCTYAKGEEYWRSTQSEGFRVLRQTDYLLFLRTAAHELLGWADDEDADRYAELMRLAVDPVEADLLIAATHNFDASDALPLITCPSLVLHRRDLHWLDIGLSRDVASRIPEARLTVVDGHSPLPPAGEASAVTETILEFLDLAPAASKSAGNSGNFRVVLFTDLVDHTHMMSALGDRRGREVLREHERITRDVLHEHGGTEIKTLGDGFLASFTRITDALGCAVNLQQRFSRRNAELGSMDEPRLKVRIGINAGEPIEEDGDLFGATVILASRIASAAQGEEVLVSNAVRELSAGNDYIFRNRGSFDAKGFDEPVQIWEVEWTT